MQLPWDREHMNASGVGGTGVLTGFGATTGLGLSDLILTPMAAACFAIEAFDFDFAIGSCQRKREESGKEGDLSPQ